jgi:Tol biopolymer transport system component
LTPRTSGSALYYLSALGTGDGLWRFQDGQSREIWNGSRGTLVDPPAISPDGLRVVIVLRKDGHSRLTLLEIDAGVTRTLVDTIDVRGSASWSPDGQWIVFGGSDQDGKQGLFKVAADGGQPTKIVGASAVDPIWSRQDVILYVGPNVAATVRLLGARPDGTPVDVGDVTFGASQARPRLMADGTGMVFVQGKAFGSDFWLLDFATRQKRQLTRMPIETGQGDIRAFDITPDSKQIIFDRIAENSDIVLIQRPPQ